MTGLFDKQYFDKWIGEKLYRKESFHLLAVDARNMKQINRIYGTRVGDQPVSYTHLKEFVDQYFEDNVYPVLTPMAMDSSRPFPLIRNKTLNIGALLSKKDTKKGKEEIDFATVQVPSVLPRVVIIPSEKKGHTTVTLLEQIIERNIDKLFLSYDVICAHPYRIMRNADLPIDEDEACLLYTSRCV